MTLTVGSFCSGYAGLEIGLGQVLDTETAWFSEVDPSACAILDARYPGVPNLGDLTAVDWSAVEPVDVLTAGYPCQPFSTAGKRKGASDARHLWPFIADAVGVLRPRLVVLENVAGHLSMGAPAVLGDLARLGYDARWTVVRASDVGACHRRARLFIVAHPADADGWRRGQLRIKEPARVEGPRRDLPHRRGEDRRLDDEPPPADARGMGWGSGPGLRPGGTGGLRGRRPSDQPGPPPARRDGPPADAEHRGRDGRSRTPGREPERRTLIGRSGGPGLGNDDPGADRGPQWGAYAPAIARHAAVVGRDAPHPVDERGRLSPTFVEWMMMLPEGWVTDVVTNRSKALKCLGNGVVPPQAAYALRRLLSTAMEAAA